MYDMDEFKVSMVTAVLTSKAHNKTKYVYFGKIKGTFDISNDMRNGWLFKSYPGGRKQLSVEGNKILEMVND